jgi:hypothetical protein
MNRPAVENDDEIRSPVHPSTLRSRMKKLGIRPANEAAR